MEQAKQWGCCGACRVSQVQVQCSLEKEHPPNAGKVPCSSPFKWLLFLKRIFSTLDVRFSHFHNQTRTNPEFCTSY